MECTDLELDGGSAFLMEVDQPDAFQRLKNETRWSQTTQNIYGRQVATPRLTAWYGDPGCSYSYSGIRNKPMPWTGFLLTIRSRVEAILECEFNSVLLNFYRSGSASIGFHADNEWELGPNPVIASLSFGCTRTFVFRHKYRRHPDVPIDLTDGSLLLMMGDTQNNWVHGIEKTREKGERINLTFRRIIGSH